MIPLGCAICRKKIFGEPGGEEISMAPWVKDSYVRRHFLGDVGTLEERTLCIIGEPPHYNKVFTYLQLQLDQRKTTVFSFLLFLRFKT